MRAEKKEILDYLQELKEEFSNKGITISGLFGSFSKETQTPYSDIDIAIEKREDFLTKHSAYDYFETLTDLRGMVKRKFHRNIDIFDLNSDTPLKKTIENELIRV